jgi:hypothetical protein
MRRTAREQRPRLEKDWDANHITASGPSDEACLPPNCPKCAKPLNLYRLLQFAIVRHEPLEFYLCHKHGFFLRSAPD